jgi:hypothetical protein
MAQFVKHDAGKKSEDGGHTPKQPGPLTVGPAVPRDDREQQEKREVQLELDTPDAEKVH